MKGYWKHAEETAAVMLPGGWLRTGDLGHMDAQGYVYLDDRKKDMIVVSGFKVFPNEVEGVLASHPGVLEVAAVAEADTHSSEAVAVFVVRKDPSLTAETLIAYAHQSLTSYKVPKHVYFRTSLLVSLLLFLLFLLIFFPPASLRHHRYLLLLSTVQRLSFCAKLPSFDHTPLPDFWSRR